MTAPAKKLAGYEDVLNAPPNMVAEVFGGEPDLGGWRVERMPELVDDDPFFTVAPDRVCEVLSPRSAKYDRSDKMAIHARERVRWIWLVDPLQRTLEALRNEGGTWSLLGTWRDEALVRVEPFDAVELELAVLWHRVVLDRVEPRLDQTFVSAVEKRYPPDP